MSIINALTVIKMKEKACLYFQETDKQVVLIFCSLLAYPYAYVIYIVLIIVKTQFYYYFLF